MELHILTYERWYLLQSLGLNTPFWSVHAQTVIATWVILAILAIGTYLARKAIKNPENIGGFLAISIVRFLSNICQQSLGMFDPKHVAFLSSLLIFIVACNLITTFVPWLEEPTSDINTTLALGLWSFFYVQAATIKAHGWSGYLKELATPIFLLPLHITGKIATIISISFRLYGNIFGGAIIVQIVGLLKQTIIGQAILLFSGVNLIVAFFFGLFEGFIQGFVFFMLSLTYLALGIAPQHDNATKEHS